MNLEDWKSQIKRGTLEFCILLLIRRKPTYGYEMISTLEQYPIVAAKENTIYPLLRRLQKEGVYLLLLAGERRGLPPRKYYAMTEAGEAYLAAMSGEWAHLVDAIQALRGEEQDGKAIE